MEQYASLCASMCQPRWLLVEEHGKTNVKHVLQTFSLFTRAGGAQRPFYNTPGAQQPHRVQGRGEHTTLQIKTNLFNPFSCLDLPLSAHCQNHSALMGFKCRSWWLFIYVEKHSKYCSQLMRYPGTSVYSR